MIYLIIFGFIAGMLSGMGVGGGILLIPALTLFLGFSQKIAQGITLVFFIPTAIFALIIHIKNKNVDFKTALRLILTGTVGAVGGALLAGHISSEVLAKIFSVFLLITGCLQIKNGLKNT